jgi:hypothetical protein
MRKEVIKYIQLEPGGDLPLLADLSPFKAVVVIEQAVPQMRQWDVSRWLVESGCRYMMAWGDNCGSWDDSVDEANLEAFNYEEIPEGSFVMTTSHEDEPLEEVFWFSKHKAHHPAIEISNCVILHISSMNKQSEMVKAYGDA